MKTMGGFWVGRRSSTWSGGWDARAVRHSRSVSRFTPIGGRVTTSSTPFPGPESGARGAYRKDVHRPAHEGIERDVRKQLPRMRADVDHARVRASGEDRKSLVLYVRGEEALVHAPGIGNPLSGFIALKLILEAPFETVAGNLAAEEERAVQEFLRLAVFDHCRAGALKGVASRHVLERKDRAVGQAVGALDEGAGMDVQWERVVFSVDAE